MINYQPEDCMENEFFTKRNECLQEQRKEKDIQRINELYNLDKSIGLTPEQKEEQRT